MLSDADRPAVAGRYFIIIVISSPLNMSITRLLSSSMLRISARNSAAVHSAPISSEPPSEGACLRWYEDGGLLRDVVLDMIVALSTPLLFVRLDAIDRESNALLPPIIEGLVCIDPAEAL